MPVPCNGKAVAFSPALLLLRLLLYQAARRQSAPFTFPRLFLSLSPPSHPTKPLLLLRLWLRNSMLPLLEKWDGWGAKKGEFSKDPWAALGTFTC